MKIVYLSSDHTAPWLTAKYVAALEAGGAEVEIMSARFPSEEFDKTIVGAGCSVRHFGEHYRLSRTMASIPYLWRWSDQAVLRIPSIRYLARLLGASADIYIAADPDDLQLAWLVARLHGARLVYIPFEYFPEHSHAGHRLARHWRRLEHRYAPAVDAWVSLGDKLSEEYDRVYCLGERLHTVYTSLPRDLAAGPLALRKRINVGAEAKIVLYQGLVARIRGVWDVLDAITLLPTDVHFVVLGFGEEFGEFRRAVASAGANGRVHVLDAVRQDELMSYTCDADIGIIPIHDASKSYRYCNPCKLFEYIAAGLPLAVSDLDQLAWYVRSRQLGEVFKWGSPPDIATALRRLLEDDRYRSACAHNSRQNHASESCWEIQAQKLRRAVFGIGCAEADVIKSSAN